MSETSICTKCKKSFLVIDQEKAFLEERDLPLPTQCSSCRQMHRLELRGSERALWKAKCQKCGKDIIVSYDPVKTKNKILCREDYQRYFEETDIIVKDPLPDI